jgi:hypothetical protein
VVTWKFVVVVLIVAVVALALGILTRSAVPAITKTQQFDAVRMDRCLLWSSDRLNCPLYKPVNVDYSYGQAKWYTDSYQVALVQLAIFRYKCEGGE